MRPLSSLPTALRLGGHKAEYVFGCLVLALALGLAAVAPSLIGSSAADDEFDALIRDELARSYSAAAGLAFRAAASASRAAMGADLLVTSGTAEAVVWLGADSAGAAPVLLTDLQPGLHTLRVISRRRVLLDTVVVLSDGTFSRLHVPGRPARPRASTALPVPLDQIEGLTPVPGAPRDLVLPAPTPSTPIARNPSRVAW